ncbi:MAG: thioredoxin domain-containing protein [Bacteroidota bacterium]
MKLLLSIFTTLLLSFSTFAQGIDFFHGEWSAALEQAKAQDKLIFVDAYAEWCGPCKRMAANVFPQEAVGAYYNRNFISLKIDMEAPENNEFRGKYPVAAFPTLFYIDAAGEVVSKVTGALDADKLIAAGKSALAQAEPSEDYATAYADGDRDPELVYKYVRSLIRNEESHLKVANDYLRDQDDLNTSENLQFILLAATEADSRIFKMMTDRKAAIVAETSEDMFYGQVRAACEATVRKAIEYSSTSLLDEAIAQMETHHSAEAAQQFRYQSQMQYAKAHRDAERYATAAEGHLKDIIYDEASKTHDFALRIANEFPREAAVLDVAYAAAARTLKLQKDTWRHHYTLAVIEKKRGRTKKARQAAEEAKKLAEEEMPGAVRTLDQFLEELE